MNNHITVMIHDLFVQHNQVAAFLFNCVKAVRVPGKRAHNTTVLTNGHILACVDT
jgi:hypothetical protein